MNLALHCLFSQCYNTMILNEKLSCIILYLLIIRLAVYQRTITRFIADDKVVYQVVRWATQLASDNCWARRRLKHLSWRSRWVILCWLEWRMAFTQNLTSWLLRFWLVLLSEHAVLQCYTRMRGLPLPGCWWTIVPVLQILFSRLSMLPSFQSLSGNAVNSLCAPYRLDRYIF